MLRLAWRQLRLDPTRTMLTATALGAVMAVMLVLSGFEQGQYFQLERNVLDRGSDLVVTQAGVSNFVAVRSSVPQLARAEVEAVDGVVNAHPITAFPVIYHQADAGSPVYVIVFDTKGGPLTLAEGHPPADSRDIVIDRSLATEYGLGLGDPMLVSDFEFVVSGVAENAAAFFTPLAFVSYDGMIDLFLESQLAPDLSTFPLLSYMLVELAPGADRESVAADIEAQVPSVDVFTPERLAERDVELGRSILGPIFGLLAAIAWAIGLLVLGLIMYAEVQARLSSFGVLKALGFSNGRLVTGVWIQTLLLFVVAIPIGLVLAWGTARVIHTAAPVYLVRVFDPATLLQTLAAGLVFAAMGAVIPVQSIRRVDPVMAFQA